MLRLELCWRVSRRGRGSECVRATWKASGKARQVPEDTWKRSGGFAASFRKCPHICHQTVLHLVPSCGNAVGQRGGGGCVIGDGLLEG